MTPITHTGYKVWLEGDAKCLGTQLGGYTFEQWGELVDVLKMSSLPSFW